MSPFKKLALPVVLFAFASAAACSDEEASDVTDITTPGAETPAPLCPAADAPPPALNDAQLIRLAIVANEGEIQAGQLAVSKASTEDARSYGETMVTEHTAANTRLTALATQLGLTPAESPLSAQLKADATQIASFLNPLAGPKFDVSYLDSQIMAHSKLLFILDGALLGTAQNAELDAELVTLRATSQEHVTHATELQATLAPDAP